MSDQKDGLRPAEPSFRNESEQGWFSELGRDADAIAEELDFAPRTADMQFVAFLRRHSQFGYFLFGPIAIDVGVVEATFYRTAKRGTGGPEHPPIAEDLVRLNRLMIEEEFRSGRPRGRELTYLLALMRFNEGLPGQVFGELGVSPEQVEAYADRLTSGQPGNLGNGGRLLSTEEAAEYYGVHVQTVRSWIRAAKLPASKLAGQKSIRIRESDLDRVLEPMSAISSDMPDG